MSSQFDDRTHYSSPDSSCAEVRELLSSVADGRATAAEEQFVRTHLPKCSGCASQLAFLQAMKTAWAKTPVEMPPLSLSARIAAQTYRKPSFAERFLAFLQPVPVRVAVGVAAVAGIAYFSLPRLQVSDVPRPVAHATPAPVIAEETVSKPALEIVEKPATKVAKPAPQIARNTAKPQPTAKPAPAAKPQMPVEDRSVAALAPAVKPEVTEPAPRPEAKKPVTPVKKAPVQVAVQLPKHTPRINVPPTESVVTAPEPRNNSFPKAPETAMATTPVESVATPQPKEPSPTRVAVATTVTEAGEDRPGLNLKNAGIRSAVRLSGSAPVMATNSMPGGIVSAPATF